MKQFALVIAIFLFTNLFSQSTVGNLITITSEVPTALTICGDAKTFSVNLNNPTPFLLQNGTVTIVVPTGMIYQSGSIIGATPVSVTTNTLVFSIADLPSLTDLDISFTALPDCDAIGYLTAGNNPKHTVRVDYIKSGSSFYDTHTTNNYFIRQPNVSITNVTNQTYTGAVGDNFTRCITIVNGGLGELKQFTLTDTHAAGLQVNSVATGAWSNTSSTLETIILSASDFAGIGDGDMLFETGESITICENITINNCIGASSDYKVFWGCNGKQCQYSQVSGNVVFPGLVPNVIVQPNNGNQTANMNSCFGPGNASQQFLKIYNSGTGTAYNVDLDIFQSTYTGGFYPYVGSYIDENSITLQSFYNGAPNPVTPISTQTTQPLGCMPTGAVGAFNVVIPTIAAGDTLYLKWNTFSCCYNYCTGIGQNFFNGWVYQGNYENVCQSSYPIAANWGRIYSQAYATLSNDKSPSTLNDGETKTFSFNLSSYGAHYNVPSSASSYWKMTFTVSPCLTYAGNCKIVGPDGVTTYSVPNSVNASGNVITAIFNGALPPSYNLQGCSVVLDLSLNCSSCVTTNTTNPFCGGSVSGGSGIDMQFTYVPNTSCGCEIVLGCYNFPVTFNCPGNCPHGIIFKKFEAYRTNYGLPDNEVGGGNGQADGTGSVDLTKIRIDRAMFKDTIATMYVGSVHTSLTYPNFQYCYAKGIASNGDKLSYVDAILKIYRSGALLSTCNVGAPVVSTSGTTRDFFYDLSVTTLGGCLPGGFVYQQDDSLVFIPRYIVSTNIAGQIQPCSIGTEFYVSPVPNPTNCNDKFQCNTQAGNINLLGYYFENWNTESYLASSCNEITLNQHYTLNIGPWFSPFANWFPFEYRNWEHMEKIEVAIPNGYELRSASIHEYRNVGSGVSAYSTQTIAPLSTSTNTLVFNVEALYQGYGGTLPLKDDGGYGYLSYVLRPTCNTVQDIKQPVVYTHHYKPINQLTGAGAYPNVLQTAYHSDTTRYDGPDLLLQSNLLTVNVPDDTTGWTINLSNNANVAAHNVWLSAPTISGVSVTKLYDLSSNTLIAPVGGIYQLGVLNAASNKNYLLVADFTSCNPDSIIVYSGWNCVGYPSSLASYPCTPLKLTLKEIPLFPNLVTTAVGPTGDIALCDTAEYNVSVVNVQLGTAYDLSLTSILPVGVTIVPGSSQLAYPNTTSFISISDPTFVTGTQWKWDLYNLNALLNNDGLKGVEKVNLDEVVIKFKVTAGCGYTSGSSINFTTKAFAACGSPTGDEVALSTNLSIAGANAPYNTNIDLRTTFISPCNLSTPMQVAIKNIGPSSTQATDSVVIVLPKGVSYVGGSFVSNHNGPINGIPTQYTLNDNTYVKWKIPTSISNTDSIVFTFNYQGDPSKLECVTSPFSASTIFKQSLVCVTGSTCDISVITGSKNLNVFTYKAYLSFAGATSTSSVTATGEDVTVNFTINNGGEAIQAGTPTTISYYHDVNNNGIYNIGDVFLTNDVFTNSIPNNGSYAYTSVINVPSGSACKIIARLDTSLNQCSCSPTDILLTPTLQLNLTDVALCSGSTNTLGLVSTTNYSYTWTPAANLSNSTISNPTVLGVNSGTSAVTYTYGLVVDRIGCLGYDTSIVIVNPKPIVSSNSSTICVGQQTASLTALGATSYTWSTGETTSYISTNPSVNTTYTVIGTDLNGCKDTAISDVVVNSLPLLTSNNATICSGQQTAGLTVSGANSYTWSTLETTSSISQSPTITTTYSVVGVDLNGCYNFTTSTIQVNDLPIITVNSATICMSQQTATLVSGGANTYTWSTLDNNPVITQSPIITSTYTVTGTDLNGCYNANTATITVNSLPTVTINSPTICLGQQTATLLANGAFSYTWSSGEFTSSITKNPSVTTTYTVIGVDLNGCRDTVTSTVSVNSLPIVASNNATICVGQQTAALTASGANSYTWSTFETTSTINQSPTVTTTYTVVGVDVNGCYNYTTSVITVNSLPPLTANNATICVGQQTASLLASGANSYTWSTGETTPNNSQSPGSTTTFTVVGLDLNGCYNYTISNVLVNSLPILTVSPVSICEGQTANLTVTGANTYTWNTLQTTSTVAQTPSITTSYTVLGKDLNNCYNVATTTITVYALPTASFISDSVCLNKATQLNDMSFGNGSIITGYAWDFNNDNIPDAGTSSPTYTFNQSGNTLVSYTVTSTPEIGLSCFNYTSQNVWVHPLPQPAFVFTNNCVNAQPNYFDAYASIISVGTNTMYAWAFGDTQMGTGVVTTHSYSVNGTFPVTLTISSNKGCQSSITHTVDVYAKPLVKITSNSKVCLGDVTTFSASTMANSGNITNWSWDLNGFIPTIEATTQSGTYTYGTPGSHTLTLLTITDRFCRDTTKLPIYVNYYPSPQFSIDVSSGCGVVCPIFSELTQAIPLPSKIIKWEWNYGDGNSTTSASNVNQTHCYQNSTTSQLAQFTPTLLLTTDSGCVASIAKANLISVYPKPVANFISIPDTADVLNPEFTFSNTSLGYTKWWWTFGDSPKIDSVNKRPNHLYDTEEPTSYPVKLIVANQYGCMDTADHVVQIAPQFAFYIPNAYSPNEDKLNDLFTGVGIGITKYEMWIYDRWGGQVYYTDEMQKGWNGRKQGSAVDCKQDVYIWKVELKDIFGKKHNYVGHVTLLR